MTQGTILLDIPPKAGNPRNSEGAFVSLKDGRLMYLYSRFRGESDSDHASADIVKILSGDNGDTWSEPETIISAAEHAAMNVMSLSLMRMGNGDIGLFYLVRLSWLDMRVVLRRSPDEGKTWGPARYCIHRPSYFVINNDRAVRLRDGRILLPVAEHPITERGGEVQRFAPGIGCCFYSDDDGETWQESGNSIAMNAPFAYGGFQEPGIIEHENGVLSCWARTTLGCQYMCYSLDRGEHWSAPTPTRFTSPCSPLSMKRLADGRLFAVWNPIPEYQTRPIVPRTGGRTPLVYALSVDDGKSWTEPVIFDDDPRAGYCYTAIFERDGFVFLGYCAGNVDVDTACLNRSRIRRFAVKAL